MPYSDLGRVARAIGDRIRKRNRGLLAEDTYVTESEPGFNFSFYALSGLTRADLLGFAPTMMDNEHPPCAVTLSNFDVHLRPSVNRSR
jgi:hypothetical protein